MKNNDTLVKCPECGHKINIQTIVENNLAKERTNFELRLKEKQVILDQIRNQMIDSQRRLEQGSISSQLHGEAQELLIEELLRNTFSSDDVEEIKKGARGADCLLIVNAPSQPKIGKIYVESKRTQSFQPAWIEKFKADMRERSATFGVLVSDAMPKGIESIGQMEGIWVCSMQEFKSLCMVLREAIVLLARAAASIENRTEKMNLLYDYFIGNEFKAQVDVVVETLVQMEVELMSEKRAIQSIWARRAKQIEITGLSMSNIFTSLRSIIGEELKPIIALELPETQIDE